MKSINSCRLCGNDNIPIIWDFGKSPLANEFKTNIDHDQEIFPLKYFKCSNCHSVQLKDEIDSDILFKNYMYESPPNLIPHFNELANTTSNFLNLNKDTDLILDIGSNNGYLLNEFKKLGYKISGIEPAANIAEMARKNGIPTFCNFFNKGFAQYLHAEMIFPKLITCTNCFAHISDLNNFVEGLEILIGKDAYFVFENAYLLNTLQNKDIGQAYFEHFYMHSIKPLAMLFEKHNLELFHVEYNKVQMGSVRGYVKSKHLIKPTNNSVVDALFQEWNYGLKKDLVYQQFINDLNRIKSELIDLLENIKRQNKTISIYGWPAKMTLINKFFGLEKYVNYIVEESKLKVGKYAPGTKLEVKSLENFKNNPTDYCILGAYNFEKDIKNKHEWYKGVWINPLNP